MHRALALFGRRPPVHVERLVMPGRVDEDVAILIPHSPGCAGFPLPVFMMAARTGARTSGPARIAA
jgi:hypothetical protein